METRYLKQTDFAKRFGLTRGRIAQLVSEGRLGTSDDGRVDLQHADTVRWMERRRIAREAAEAGMVAPEPTDDLAAAVTAAELPLQDRLEAQRVLRDIELKEERRRGLEQKRRKEAGELIEKPWVTNWVASLHAGMRIHLLRLPDRIAPHVAATARTEGDKAVRELLRDEIAGAIHRLKREVGDELEQKRQFEEENDG